MVCELLRADHHKPMIVSATRNRTNFGDSHPVDPVHEIDEVDEPQGGDEEHGALHGARGAMRSSVGNATRTAMIAAACIKRRGVTGTVRKSSAMPTIARKTAAAKTSHAPATGPPRNATGCAVTIVAVMTAMPPPCGVGMVCDERALGLAIA